MRAPVYEAPLIYKYFAPARRQFFVKPQVRFSQREALNDPLEMSTRWKEISADGLHRHLDARLQEAIPKIFSNTELLIEMFREDLAGKGMALTAPQAAQIEQLLKSDAGKTLVEQQLLSAQALIQVALNYLFARFEAELQTLIDNVIIKMGVFSLTEAPLNQQMWAHYATGGTGFVVGLDAQHAFFTSDGPGEKKNLLRKVIYTDEKTDNFWRNPYFLFLVKSAGWSYECEWRLLKQLTKCDEQILTEGLAICLANLPPNIIKSVYFGYGYDPSEMKTDIANLIKVGAAPDFFQVRVNRQRGVLEPVRV